MLDPLDFENRPFLDALSRKRRAAFMTLAVERFTLHFWRLLFWVLFFMGLWMLEFPQFFGLVGKSITTTIFLGGFIYFLRQDGRKFKLPAQNELDRRLEDESVLLQGSIGNLEDRLANPKKHATRDLWNLAQKQIVSALPLLKSPSPKALLVRKDPNALRFIAVLLFLSGLMVSGPDWRFRLWEGFMPVVPKFSLAENKAINLWIKPPEYTGAAQIHLTGAGSPQDGLKIPQGSEIKARVYSPLGKFIAPSFRNGDQTVPMKYMGEGLYSFEGVIRRGPNLAVTQSIIPRARWDFLFVNDTPPQISITKPESKEDETKPEIKETDPLEEKKEEVPPKAYDVMPSQSLRFYQTVRDD